MGADEDFKVYLVFFTTQETRKNTIKQNKSKESRMTLMKTVCIPILGTPDLVTAIFEAENRKKWTNLNRLILGSIKIDETILLHHHTNLFSRQEKHKNLTYHSQSSFKHTIDNIYFKILLLANIC